MAGLARRRASGSSPLKGARLRSSDLAYLFFLTSHTRTASSPAPDAVGINPDCSGGRARAPSTSSSGQGRRTGGDSSQGFRRMPLARVKESAYSAQRLETFKTKRFKLRLLQKLLHSPRLGVNLPSAGVASAFRPRKTHKHLAATRQPVRGRTGK